MLQPRTGWLSRRLLHSCTQHVRHMSSNPLYDAKVYALPFRLDPEVAIARMQTTIGLYNQGVLSTLRGLFSSLSRGDLSGNIEAPELDKFEAVYFPAWIVSAELEVPISWKDSGKEYPENAFASFQYSYIPGSIAPEPLALSNYEITHGKLENIESFQQSPFNRCIPFNESLRRQQSMNVNCIPFSTSPFPLDGEIFSPGKTYPIPNVTGLSVASKPKVAYYAAYPVLLPLYLGEIEIVRADGSRVTRTHWVEAFYDLEELKGRNAFALRNFSTSASTVPGETELDEHGRLLVDNSMFYSADRLIGYLVAPDHTSGRIINATLEGQLMSNPAVLKYIESIGPPQWNDPRIRAWTTDNLLSTWDEHARIREENIARLQKETAGQD